MCTWHAFGVDSCDDPIAIPLGCEHLRSDMEIVTIEGVARTGRHVGRSKQWKVGQPLCQQGRELSSSVDPGLDLLELSPPDRSLHLGHPQVRPESIVKPPEARRVLAV